MKEIITPKGKLVLKPDTTIDISKTNPLFNRAEEFSISLSVPRKPNDPIFNYQYRQAGKLPEPMDVQFLYHGCEKLRGTIEVMGDNDEEYSVLMKGGRNHFMFKYGRRMLRAVDYQDELFVPGNEAPTNEQIADEMLNTLNPSVARDWMVFPVVNVGYGWINPWDFRTGKFEYGTGAGTYTPFLKLYRAIERLFQAFGYTVTENWFSGMAERKRIVLFNNANLLGGNTNFNISYLFPDLSINTFLNELEDFFPVTFYINTRNKTVMIKADDRIGTMAPTFDITKYVKGKPKHDYSGHVDGYKLEYEFPDDETTSQEWDHTSVPKGWQYPEVAKFSSLPAPSSDGMGGFVAADGQYYHTESDGEGFAWKRIGSVANTVISGNGDIDRTTKIYPLMSATYTMLQTVPYTSGPEFTTLMKLQVPITAKSPNLWDQDMRLVVYRGMCDAEFDPPSIGYEYKPLHLQYPMGNFVNRKMDGTAWTGDSLELRWDGDQGLRGAETIAFLVGAVDVEVTMVMNHREFDTVDLTGVVSYLGQRAIIIEAVPHYGTGSNIEIDVKLKVKPG